MRNVRTAPLAGLFLVVAAAALAVGCANTKAAYQEAQSLDEYAYVVTEHYSALVKQAADIASRPGTPPAAIDALKKADKAVHDIVIGTPTTPGLRQLAATYTNVKNAETQEALQSAVNDAVLQLANLLRAIKSAGGAP
jgi:hypothetical protein